MAVPLTPIPAAGGSSLLGSLSAASPYVALALTLASGGNTGQGKVEDAQYQADRNAELAKTLQMMGLPLTEETLAMARNAMAFLNPVQNQMGGWMANLAQIAPGTQIPLPSSPNVDIPPWLRGGLEAPEGSWQNKVARLAFVNWKLPGAEQQYYDMVKDITKGENPDKRIARQIGGKKGWQAIPADWQAPSLTSGGGNITVPGGGTGVGAGVIGGGEAGATSGMPDWLTPSMQPGLEESLLNTPDWTAGGYSPSELTQLMEPQELQQNEFAKGLGDMLGSSYRQRGLGQSSMADAMQLVPSAWLGAQRATNRANTIGMVKTRGDALRNEQRGSLTTLQGLKSNLLSQKSNNFYNLWNTMSGRATTPGVSGDTSQYAKAFMDAANQYSDKANALGQQQANKQAMWGNIFGNTISQPWNAWQTGNTG